MWMNILASELVSGCYFLLLYFGDPVASPLYAKSFYANGTTLHTWKGLVSAQSVAPVPLNSTRSPPSHQIVLVAVTVGLN